MRRFTLDTSCIIAAVGGEPASNQIEELVDLARSGKIGIVITSGFDVDQRTAIVLREIDGLSYDEIAFSLGVAIGTVKSRLTRARQALRVALREDRNP